MRILVTGSAGFVGKNLLNYLSKKKIKIFALYNKTKPTKIKNIKFLKSDIKKLKKIPNNIDCLIHLAVKNPENTSGPMLYRENVECTKKIFTLAKKNNIKKIIFFSSIAVYEKLKEKLINENIIIKKPQSYYAISKFEGEELLKKLFNKSNVSTFIIRLPSIIGPGSRFNAISDIKEKISKGEKIFIKNPDVKYNRVIYIETLNKFVLNILKLKKITKTTIHLASRNPINFKTVILLMFRALKKKPNIVLLNNEKKLILNISKAKKYSFRPLTVRNTLYKYFLNEKTKT